MRTRSGFFPRTQPYATALAALIFIAVPGARHKQVDPRTFGPAASSRLAAVSGSVPQVPKVPFGNHPCQSLSSSDETTLKMIAPVVGKPDRGPATLPVDNNCTYVHGGTRYVQLGYETKSDYDMNASGNRSSSRKAPADIPGAFYDGQGGLWFAKSGYFVVVSGRSELKEPVARVLAAKL